MNRGADVATADKCERLDPLIWVATFFFVFENLACPFRKSYPDVLVVQSSQDRNGDNGARSLDCSMQGRIFL
jgi:hypothetical protein